MAESDVTLRVNEVGADQAAAKLDRVSLNIGRLGAAVSGLGRLARLAGDDFGGLADKIGGIAGQTAGFAQIGSLFGPQGTAIGAGLGLITGIAQEFLGSKEQAPKASEKPFTVNVENNIKMEAKVTSETLDAQLRQIVNQFDAPLGAIKAQTQNQIENILRQSTNGNAGFPGS